MEQRPVIIVGSGPAGTATALFLQRRDPAIAADILLLEKSEHPREKVCAGGLIPHTIACLDELDVPLDVPHVTVNNARILVSGREVNYRGSELCRVVRRAEFDASLVRACAERDIEVRQRERVCNLIQDGNGIRVETEKCVYRAQVVVGADGSGSVVRRRLIWPKSVRTGRAVMCDVPLRTARWNGFSDARYEFNFRPVAERLRGYVWAFPCLIGGEPHINVGAYSVHPEGRYLLELLENETARLGGAVSRFRAFPIHWYHHSDSLSSPRALLVGDAAGVDPLMGEGISYAFEYGRSAAAAIARAFGTGDFAFDGYTETVRGSWMGRKLRRLGLAARLFYGPTSRLCFAIASRTRRGQELGIRWYNGVDGSDRIGLWSAVGLLRARKFASRS